MKTLDEVIDALEVCSQMDAECDKCPYHATAKGWCEEKDRDALHYLKELKDILDPLKVKKISYEITCPQCNSVIAILLPESNDPLDWDELKQMEGKPVWIEEYGRKYATPHWAILSGIEEGYYGDEILYLEPFETFTKNDMGKTWKAYRKERE